MANTFSSLPDAAYCIFDNVLGVPGGGQVVVDPEPVAASTVLGRYWGYSSIGFPFQIDVTLDGTQLMMDLQQVTNPLNRGSGRLVRAYRDTYVVDPDDDEAYDLDFTFMTSEGQPGRTSWLVNRSLVLEREVGPRWASRP